jgi:hypothetical protein
MMNLSLNLRVKQYLFYAVPILLSCWFLISYFDIFQTLNEANARKEILIENISEQGHSSIYLKYISQFYWPLPMKDFVSGKWKLGKLPGSDLDVLTSTHVGDHLKIKIPIAGSTQFIFVTSPDSGKVRVTDLETGQVSELGLQAAANYTVTLSTVSGTKRGWDLFLVSLVIFIGAITLTATALMGWKKGLRVWEDADQSPLAYAVIGLTLLLNNLFMTQRLFFFGDSKNYWELGPTFVKDGVFSFSNLESVFSFRGYFMPLIVFISQKLGEILRREFVLIYVLLMAFLYILFFVFIVPKIIRWLTGTDARPYHLLIVFALIGFFWLGWFTWLLSDLLAVCAFLAGLVLMLEGIARWKWYSLIVGGICMGIAINCRPSYELGLAASFGLIIYFLYKERATSNTSLGLLSRKFLGMTSLYLLGLVLVSLPQAEINWRQFQTVSLFPFASSNPNSSGLEAHGTFFEYSLAYGRLRTQGWPYPYPNRIGMSVLYRYFGIDPTSLGDYQAAGAMLHQHGGMNVPLYLNLVRKYPLEFTVDFFLKTFTGLNNQSFEPYPVNWHAGPLVALFTFFNYFVLFLVILIFYHRLSDLANNRQGNPLISLWYLTLALPALAYVPLFIEWRFFLPIYLSMYFLLVTTDRSVYTKIFSNKLWPLQFIFFILICYSLSALVSPIFLE